MCVSNNFIEQQAYNMAGKIQKNSLYKLVRIDYSYGKSIGFEKQDGQGNHFSEITTNGGAVITKVLLEDKDGTLYSVEPNINGLRFAKGEINYSKYRKLQRKNDFTMFICFFVIIGFFGVSMLLMSKLI
ncbi:hypothetical protein [Bacillus sp. MRMR6]|uniref:hypothetical protein n=1 Tax=Bacillus sp. MRMR6 TaxID=1928617 RepID=UPI0009519005|nr:hypothetical protein [Bacillus sp. MRMR6]OLS33384.1 hypothetical protein BTR25_26170 [Bacillus sp. MRMR6]